MKFLHGDILEFTIPPEDYIEKYADSLLGDHDFSNNIHGEIVYFTINEFIKEHPDLNNLYISQARCLYTLCFDGLSASLIKNNNSNEVGYVELLKDLAISHPEIPELSWYICAYLYSRCFTSITSSPQKYMIFLEYYENLLKELPGNENIVFYYTRTVQTIFESTHLISGDKAKYISIIKDISTRYYENEDIIRSCSEIFVFLIYDSMDICDKTIYLDKIKMVINNNAKTSSLLALYNFGLLDLIIHDEANRLHYIKEIMALNTHLHKLEDILQDYYWEINYEHFGNSNRNRSFYFKNIDTLAKMFPDFPDFVLVQRNLLINLIKENGHAVYRDPALILLKAMTKCHPGNIEVAKTYAQGLYFKLHYSQDAETKEVYLREIRNLLDKEENQEIIEWYIRGIDDIIWNSKENMTQQDIQSYFSIVESYYTKYQNSEDISESYSKIIWHVSKKSANVCNVEKDYLSILCKNAHLFPKNEDIVEKYLYALEGSMNKLESIIDPKKYYDEALKFSYLHPHHFGDITYTCFEILRMLFQWFIYPLDKKNCLKELKRIAANMYGNHRWNVSDFLSDLIDETDDLREKENYFKMIKEYCREEPWDAEIAWYYVHGLKSQLFLSNDLMKKLDIFEEMTDWTILYPGAFPILEEYVESLFHIAYLTKDDSTKTEFKEHFVEFVKKNPAIALKMGLEEKEEYKTLIPS